MSTPEGYNLTPRPEPAEALSQQERLLAAEIDAQLRLLGPRLDVSVPPGALMRVHARMAAARAGTNRRPRWAPLAAAAAAAAIVLAAIFLPTQPPRGPTGAPTTPEEYVRHFLMVPEPDLSARTQMLSEEMADYQMELALADDPAMEITLSGLEQELGAFDLDEEADLEVWAE